jgi:hypothetical protein
MAGSYEHLKRDPNSYGGVNTSLCENMGDAIEAMTHMYWMIEILSLGDKKRIKAASKRALEIEVGREEWPAEPL